MVELRQKYVLHTSFSKGMHRSFNAVFAVNMIVENEIVNQLSHRGPATTIILIATKAQVFRPLPIT